MDKLGVTPDGMNQRVTSYLRSHRRRWGLTQGEVAYLLGLKNGSVVSRIERERRRPKLPVALACQVVFDIPTVELFPGLFTEVEDAVMRRTYHLHERLQGNQSASTRTKLDLLDEVLKRAVHRNKRKGV
jgi:DNA-binding XRE family transcriptional regulator